jgi:hypothetical protein
MTTFFNQFSICTEINEHHHSSGPWKEYIKEIVQAHFFYAYIECAVNLLRFELVLQSVYFSKVKTGNAKIFSKIINIANAKRKTEKFGRRMNSFPL